MGRNLGNVQGCISDGLPSCDPLDSYYLNYERANMKALTIYSNGHISLNGAPTGYGVRQKYDRTMVYRLDDGHEIPMPDKRYSLSCDKPARGHYGLPQFESAFLEATQGGRK